ncbi:MAG: argininosuccinate lyase [Proteobacteria bacterium]|nr:argininosuccinate lyase [Pseudomonadota bacterium]
MTKKTNSNSMWGGRFAASPSQIMQKINQSISFDKKLYLQDITGSIAHATMLATVGILTKDEANKIISGLGMIEKEIENGEFEFKEELEDIHMNIEARLAEIIGDVAGKLHTARSRNDQVITDFKLYIRHAFDEIDGLLQQLQENLLDKAQENVETILPGFTHLQTAQPVSFGHHLLAYFEMIKRDRSRIQDSRKRINQCPLGVAALAGTSFPIDRFQTAKLLGFDAPTANSLDTVSDRDFVFDFLSTMSILAVHLSRLAEEIVLWMSKGFDFIELSDAFTSGSSIMPQKKNPDAAELIRAKTGRIFGSLVNILTVIKALPLAYSKDMQEDKEPVFDAYENIKIAILAISGMVEDLKVKKENMLEMSKSGFSTATDLADWLVKNLGIPFRKCHHITGQIVKLAEDKNCDLADLSLAEMQKIEAGITEDIYQVLTVENSVKSRESFGGTAFKMVEQSIKEARKYIK